jgi:hypothetical protein
MESVDEVIEEIKDAAAEAIVRREMAKPAQLDGTFVSEHLQQDYIDAMIRLQERWQCGLFQVMARCK